MAYAIVQSKMQYFIAKHVLMKNILALVLTVNSRNKRLKKKARFYELSKYVSTKWHNIKIPINPNKQNVIHFD